MARPLTETISQIKVFERKHLTSSLSSNKLDHETTIALLNSNSRLVYKIGNQQGPTV